jgi:HSP20 family protein
MSIVRYSPLSAILNRWPDVWDEDLFDSTANSNLNVYETKSNVIVEANVAGVDSEDLDITFEKGVLWIQAKKKQEEKDEERKYYSRSSFSYSYKVAIPGDIDLGKEPEVTNNNGVLRVEFKKSEQAQPKKLKVNG